MSKRLLLSVLDKEEIEKHLSDDFLNRVAAHVFQTQMLMAEFRIHMENSTQLNQFEQKICSPIQKRGLNSNIEMDMDGKFVLSIHRVGEKPQPFSRISAQEQKQKQWEMAKNTSRFVDDSIENLFGNEEPVVVPQQQKEPQQKKKAPRLRYGDSKATETTTKKTTKLSNMGKMTQDSMKERPWNFVNLDSDKDQLE